MLSKWLNSKTSGKRSKEQDRATRSKEQLPAKGDCWNSSFLPMLLRRLNFKTSGGDHKLMQP